MTDVCLVLSYDSERNDCNCIVINRDFTKIGEVNLCESELDEFSNWLYRGNMLHGPYEFTFEGKSVKLSSDEISRLAPNRNEINFYHFMPKLMKCVVEKSGNYHVVAYH